MWVSPFRNLRIIGYLLLPVAYRSLSRLSSALSAKASTLRSSSLNQIYLDLRVRVRYLTCIALHALIGCVYTNVNLDVYLGIIVKVIIF